MENTNELVTIDGNYLEGGGQILRISVALGAILNIPIKINNIRAGRSVPGLRPQHLTGVRLVRDLTGGTLKGDEIGSTEIEFWPGTLKGGEFSVDTGTAGSITLIIQAVLPCLLFAAKLSTLKMRGGTDVGMAPPFDYCVKVTAPIVKKMGGNFNATLIRRGFYPKGCGEVCLSVNPVKKLEHITIDSFQTVRHVTGSSFVAGTIPIRVAKEMSEAAEKKLLTACKDLTVSISHFKEPESRAFGNGVAIILTGETPEGLAIGGSSLGKPGIPAARVGQAAADEIIESVASRVALDQHSQDQVIIFMALAEGVSRVLVGPLTNHTRTAIFVTSLLTKVSFQIIDQKTNPETFVIECNGLGLVNKQIQ